MLFELLFLGLLMVSLPPAFFLSPSLWLLVYVGTFNQILVLLNTWWSDGRVRGGIAVFALPNLCCSLGWTFVPSFLLWAHLNNNGPWNQFYARRRKKFFYTSSWRQTNTEAWVVVCASLCISSSTTLRPEWKATES